MTDSTRIGVLGLLLAAAGCGGDSAAETVAQARLVYFDSESKQPVVAETSSDTPVINPATGRRTLMPALYCAKCNKWRAAAPLAELQRNPQARTCAKCKGSLTADGPLPETPTQSGKN